jgi:hypothetical protein
VACSNFCLKIKTATKEITDKIIPVLQTHTAALIGLPCVLIKLLLKFSVATIYTASLSELKVKSLTFIGGIM